MERDCLHSHFIFVYPIENTLLSETNESNPSTTLLEIPVTSRINFAIMNSWHENDDKKTTVYQYNQVIQNVIECVGFVQTWFI